jgi:hypothetical protein
MKTLIFTIIVSLLAFLFGAAKDRKVGKVDAAFLLIALFGAAGYFFSLRGAGIEFRLAITPLDVMVLLNTAIGVGLVVVLAVFAAGALRPVAKRSGVFAAAIALSLIGYIILPNLVKDVLFFLPKGWGEFIAPILFAVILLIVELSASKQAETTEEKEGI